MTTEGQKAQTYPFSLTPLAYAYDALEPYIDAATMRLHHTKHHQSYIDHLNTALKDYPNLHGFSIEELLRRLDKLPIAIRQAVHDQGGGHFHHRLFWDVLSPPRPNASPDGELAEAIEKDFASFPAFKEKFVEIGTKHFASGWVFLAFNPSTAKLEVLARADQDNILLEKKTPLLLNDLWEHAYYLKYHSDRPAYLNSFWSIVNWEHVALRYQEILSTKENFMRAPKRFL